MLHAEAFHTRPPSCARSADGEMRLRVRVSSTNLLAGAVIASLILTSWAAATDTPKVIVCYYPQWSHWTRGIGRFLPSNLCPGLCSHINFAFTKINTNYQMGFIEAEDAATVKGIVMATKGTSTKIFLSVGGGGYPSAQFSQLAAVPARRTTFINSVVTMLRAQQVHGLDVDWENPAANGGRPVDKANFVTLLKELRAAFVAEATATGRPRLQLSAALAVGPDVLAKSYDVKGINANLDLLHIMTYCYADPSWSDPDVTGHNAPLKYPGSSAYNVEANINQWIAAGASPSKMTLGIPTYAVTWTLANNASSGVGAAVLGGGNPRSLGYGRAGPITAIKTSLAYYEVQAVLASGGTYRYDAASQAFYVVKGDQWISVEKPGLPPAVAAAGDPPVGSLVRKAQFILQKGLAGAMFWEVSQDAFQNHQYPLINTVRNVLNSGSVPTA